MGQPMLGNRFRVCLEMPRVSADLRVIPGWSEGPGPEPMNTGHPQRLQARVHGFRALGRSRPRAGLWPDPGARAPE
jgi:hypothetical protein